jgi:hypothetical protein
MNAGRGEIASARATLELATIIPNIGGFSDERDEAVEHQTH